MFARYLKDELFRSSIILIVLSNLGNGINLIFQFFMARMLSDSDFGVFAFLINLFFIFAVPALAIQTAISKKTTELNSKKEYGKIKGLFKQTTKKLFFISVILGIIFIILSFLFHKAANIDFPILALSSVAIIFSLIGPVILGILQGLKKFTGLGWNGIIGFSTKLILSIILVYMGFRVYGAVIGIIVGMFASWFAALWFIKDFKEEKENAKLYSLKELGPFIVLFVITLIYSVDVLLGKFLFDPNLIGNYSRISLLGKMILFACMSISTVMFPISLERHIKGVRSTGIIRKSSILVFVICFFGLLFFYLFPEQIIGLLFGARYVAFAYLLLPLGFAFSFISGINLIVVYGLSINKFKLRESLFLGLLFIAQVIALVIFSQTLLSFALTFMISSAIIFILALILSLKWKN